MSLPVAYAWLGKESAPRMLLEGLKTYGTIEAPGTEDNPVIMAWAKEVGVPRIADVFTSDAVPWCGLWMAVVAHRAGKPVNPNALWARSWLSWGAKVSGEPKLGDVLVFRRGQTSGHVGLYVGEDATHFHVLGGNQGDAVSILRLDKDRLLGARNFYATAQPANCRRVFLKAGGAISTNEA
ncbi:MAG: TIGR02594 family protein [Hyphomonas sp.]|uniref:TIGR02594 family protein n=1 Tax=Hyphomonas sp. TaxID=87 RepID=UPI0025C2F180|nr:TIGR02594 family protein [Hyphomonas sp.]MBA4338309.1 TIGR02594 family protein [Hyphomonas sp.]